MPKVPIWLDCDPGHDDAFAIILAGHDDRLNLLGISTVAGNQTVDKTTINALQVLQLSGLDHIDVVKGQAVPLVEVSRVCPEIHGSSGLDCSFQLPPVKRSPLPQKAVLKMAETFLNSQVPITLLATGALTNVALLLSLFPEVKEKIEKIVLMGGSIGLGNMVPGSEWNIYVDPEAAKIVFDAGVPLFMVPLEVTHTALSTPSVLERIKTLDSNFATLMVDFLQFFRHTYDRVFGLPNPPLHDPCAVAYVIDPSLFKTKLMRVDIETKSVHCNGRTVCDLYGMTNSVKNAHVALEMDVPKFWELMFSALEKANAKSIINHSPLIRNSESS